ncbi:uncharacterized protein MELLADRAFT_67801 [Melampsora larici-populina 98AG31]|uniref:Uncharacterized protein n=1 Tax=Melampsora larici-populina (strain 98AG31 / pathotype 3-4-7) TaxID=747676 RepID=F4S4G9_MELLP|nr:uncharacterized protein MELLADRAFT_67801 [Melampsora larici-populina 98AG31]EGG00468.1 hypothetical protein MELLADRAFT_67801 [Melampsora larici-populina 98AG31]
MINFQSYLSIKSHSNHLSSKPFRKLHSLRISTYNLILQPFHTTTNQPQQQQAKPKPFHKHRYSSPERRIKEPFLSILLPIKASNQSTTKRNYQNTLKPNSMNPIRTHHPNQPNQIIPNPSNSIHPITQVLNKYQTSSRISTTSQLLSEALQSVLNQSDHSSNLESSHHTSSDQDWCLIYLKYLQSSKNPLEFSKRLGDLIINRLPRYRSDQIIQLHSKHTSLRHLVSTDSYNQLIKFYYLSNRYDQVRLILKELKERGLNLNLQSFELILYSYQALNKSKGVKLTIEKIQSLGLSISLDTWVTLFSIKPRQSSRTRHLDSMEDNSPSISSLDQFLNGWKWDPSELHSNGKAIITLSKKLMQDGKWNEAFRFIDTALVLNYLHHDPTNPTKKSLTSFWAREFLHTLLYGLYNLKQENQRLIRTKPNRSSNINRDPIRSNFQTPLPFNQSIFKFVEDFIDKHRDGYPIQVNSSILLNCLRIETCHSPSKLKSIIQKWNKQYGLETQNLGSRSSIRFLHIVSTWFTKSIPTESREDLMKEYSVLKEFWDTDLKEMMKRGPIDGKIKRGLFVFWTSQRIQSIRISLNRIKKIKRKLDILSDEDELKLDLNFLDELVDDVKKLKSGKESRQQTEIQDQVLYKWWSEKPNLKEIKVKV